MAKTGRPKSVNPRVPVTIHLNPQLLKALDLIDYDPFLDRRAYNVRNIHLEKAIAEYLEKYYPEILRRALTGGNLS